MTLRELARRLKGYARPHWWRVALSVFAAWGIAASDGAMAKLVQPFVDRLIIAREARLMIWVPVVIVGIHVFKAACSYVQSYFIKTAGQLTIQRIRNEVFEHTLSLSMRYHGKHSSGMLISRILNDVQSLQTATGELLIGVMRDAMTLIVLLWVAFSTDWKMTTIAFVTLPLAAWPVALIGRKLKLHSKRSQTGLGTLTVALQQSYSGVKVIKGFGAEDRQIERFRKENKNFYEIIRKIYKYDAASAPFVEIITGFGTAAILWYGMHRVLAGDMTQGQLFAVVTAIMLMYMPFKRLTKMNNHLQMALTISENVFRFLQEQAEIADAPGAVELPRVRGEVRFEQVSFAYDDTPVLKNFSLQASPGEVVALVGPSGAGKTTVTALLCRFYDPDAGRILFDGQDIRTVTVASLKRQLAMVDQESFLFNDTIANNIRYSRRDASDEEVREASRLAYADDFIRDLPEGYETSIGDRGLRLSGGQRQRICIARALLRQAPILILDEATSALDTESETIIQQALKNLMKDRTTFVIAHRLSTIMDADKIVVMDGGSIVDIGTHRDLIGRDGLYKKLHKLQFCGDD